jgi:hypothetical protein
LEVEVAEVVAEAEGEVVEEAVVGVAQAQAQVREE